VISELMGWHNVLGETSSRKWSRSHKLLCAILTDIFAIMISFKFDSASDEYFLTKSVQNEDEYLLSLLLALISKSMIGRWELFQLYRREKLFDETEDEEGGEQSEPIPPKKKSRSSSVVKKTIGLKSGNNRRKAPQRHTKKRQLTICDDNDGVIYCYNDDDDDDRSKRFLEEWFSAHRGRKLLTENNLRLLQESLQ
jgi:hypothetical protein